MNNKGKLAVYIDTVWLALGELIVSILVAIGFLIFKSFSYKVITGALLGRHDAVHKSAGSYCFAQVPTGFLVIVVKNKAEQMVDFFLGGHGSKGILYPSDLLFVQKERIASKVYIHSFAPLSLNFLSSDSNTIIIS
jgi:hypothetical protein